MDAHVRYDDDGAWYHGETIEGGYLSPNDVDEFTSIGFVHRGFGSDRLHTQGGYKHAF